MPTRWLVRYVFSNFTLKKIFNSLIHACGEFCVRSRVHVQVKYKGDLKKLHKPVTDMAESLSMQHSLSTSKLSSQVRSHHPPSNPPPPLPSRLAGGFRCAPLWLAEAHPGLAVSTHHPHITQ